MELKPEIFSESFMPPTFWFLQILYELCESCLRNQKKWVLSTEKLCSWTAQNIKFPIKDLFNNCDQIRRKLKELLKKFLMKNLFFCEMLWIYYFFPLISRRYIKYPLIRVLLNPSTTDPPANLHRPSTHPPINPPTNPSNSPRTNR